MPKKQTGFRIDRVLYERFQKLRVTEKLRPGEAVGQLVRLAVDSGSVAEVHEGLEAGTGPSSDRRDPVQFKTLKIEVDSRLRKYTPRER